MPSALILPEEASAAAFLWGLCARTLVLLPQFHLLAEHLCLPPYPALLYPTKEEGGCCSILHLGSLCYFGYSLCFPCLFLPERMPAVRDPPLPSEHSACQLQASGCSQQLSEDSQTCFLSVFTGQEGS